MKKCAVCGGRVRQRKVDLPVGLEGKVLGGLVEARKLDNAFELPYPGKH